MNIVHRIIHLIDENIEKVVMVVSYSAMAAIIFIEVVRRFLLNQQAPWSTTIPVLLFLWLTWFGASYNIKKRTHLALTEVRARLSYNLQFCCLVLDSILWIIFAGVVIYFTYQQVYLSYENFAIVGGTDNIMEWWFYLATPLAWSLIIVRVIQNLIADYGRYKRHEPFILQGMLND